MVPNKWMTYIYACFIKFGLTVLIYGDSNQCDPVEPSKITYDYTESIAIR